MSDPITAQEFMAGLSCNSGTRGDPATNPLTDEVLSGLRAQLAAMDLDLRRERLKNRVSLANNMCPDHRDKQSGKPCLACTVETLTRENAEAREQLADADRTLAGFTRAVREARECIVAIRDMANNIDHDEEATRIVKLCEAWLSPPLAAVPAARVLTEGGQ